MSDIDSLIAETSRRYGIPEQTLRTFVRIESGGNPNAVTGQYRGLLQMGQSEWQRYGGGRNIFDPAANLDAGARKLVDESRAFAAQHGREPTAADLYLVHQQGSGGAAAHLANPTAPAWRNMAGTGEGRQKGEGWARAAIWGNIPDQDKRRFGSVDNVTSKDFVDLWTRKVSGGPAPAVVTPKVDQPHEGMEYEPIKPPAPAPTAVASASPFASSAAPLPVSQIGHQGNGAADLEDAASEKAQQDQIAALMQRTQAAATSGITPVKRPPDLSSLAAAIKSAQQPLGAGAGGLGIQQQQQQPSIFG